MTEGETLSITVRPSYAPGPFGVISSVFHISIEIDDESKFVVSAPETVVNNYDRIQWSTADHAWQTYHTVTFTAEEDSDSQDESVTLRFIDYGDKYNGEFMTFTVNITDDDEAGGL